jgi:hypothetical protein
MSKRIFQKASAEVMLNWVLPTSWGKMFLYVAFWANAVRPYIVVKMPLM